MCMGVAVTRVVKFLRKGVGIEIADVEYADSTSGAAAPTAGWHTVAPAWQNGHYIWTRTHMVYTDGTDSYSSPVCLPSGKGIANIKEQYYLSTSSTALAGGSWLDVVPSWTPGKYIWTRSVITFTDNSVSYTDPINPSGQKGDQGDKGDTGSRGPVLRGPQAWSDCADGYLFEQGADGESWVDVVMYQNNYYSCKKSHVKTSSNYPGSAASENQGLWQLGDKIELVATKILLATYALVKNLGVEAVDMKDDQGNILFQVKDGNVTCKTGNFENVTISGILSGVTGSFKNLDCVDTNGNKVGGINFGSDGKMWLAGDLYNQGYDAAKKRGYRFYSSDIWCRGQFGAAERNTLVVQGGYGYYFTNGMSKSGVYVSFTQKTSNGETYYEIPCYGQSDDAAGFPVDTIIFAISLSLNYLYDLVAFDSQRILLVNANDNYGNVNIISNGSKVTLEGGEMAEVVKIPAAKMIPQLDASILGKGLLFGPRYDNTWH